MTFIDMTNPDTRKKVVLLHIISGLGLELQIPGMRVSRGVQPLAALKRDYSDFTGRTKKQGIQFAVTTMQELDPGYEPSPSIRQFL